MLGCLTAASRKVQAASRPAIVDGFHSALRTGRCTKSKIEPGHWLDSTAMGSVVGSRGASVMSRASSFEALPVLDYRDLDGKSDDFAIQLRNVCQNVGFFVLAGLPPKVDTINKEVLQVARDFFALPLEKKQSIDYRENPQFRGYIWLGAENTAGKRDEREQIEFGREEPVPPLGPGAPLFDRLRGPNQWPSEPQRLRGAVLDWLHEMEFLSRKVTQALSASLGLSTQALDGLFEHPHVQAKIVHYPSLAPCTAASTEDTDTSLGVGAHSDSGFMTLLLQDEVGGLEVLSGSGQWVPAVPLPGSVVCNLGEVVQLLTGGRYLSTVHRVLRPQTSAGRVSAPFFWNPSLDVIVQELDLESISNDNSIEKTACAERPAEDVNRLLPSYGMNAFKSLARSHPTVFARHHPDLRSRPDGLVELR